jgi:hypothetical protein
MAIRRPGWPSRRPRRRQHRATTRPAHVWATDNATTPEDSGNRGLSERDRRATLRVIKEKGGMVGPGGGLRCASSSCTSGARTHRGPSWPVLSLGSMDHDQKEILRKTFPEARGLVVSMITAALAAQVDGDEDLFGEVLAELGKAQRVTIRAVLMTQTWTLANAIMAMAEVAEKDPREYWAEVALKLTAFKMKEDGEADGG